MFIKQEVVFALMAGVFVMETLSVMLQVGYFKWSKGKRLFKMAPLHHHFELSGIAETKIVVRFWIIGLIFVALGVCLIM
jgi:phospho-N-acetylmuramoyl-pentapeptide-transferase